MTLSHPCGMAGMAIDIINPSHLHPHLCAFFASAFISKGYNSGAANYKVTILWELVPLSGCSFHLAYFTIIWGVSQIFFLNLSLHIIFLLFMLYSVALSNN